MGNKLLLLWGDTSSGKSTLLTMALNDPQFQSQFDMGKIRDLLNHERFREGHLLRKNRTVDATTVELDLQLKLAGNVDQGVTIRDIRGGDAGSIASEALGWVDEADGVMFVVEWEGQTFENQMAAIRFILPFVKKAGKLFGLAITKCEKSLLIDDPAWKPPLTTASQEAPWWVDDECWSRFSDTLAMMESRIWVTSAFGYDSNHRPAVLLGEYGQWLPYKIQPKNVALPFAWFFSEFAK